MADSIAPERRSPLAHRSSIAAERDAVRLAEVPFLTKHVLRVDPEIGGEAVKSALGLELPQEPLTSSRSDEVTCLWLGPDEWMIAGEDNGVAADLAEALAQELGETHHQLADVSDYYTVIEVAGPRARDALMKLTTLDIHPRALQVGQVTGSIFGHANAWLWLTGESEDDGPAFRLIVRWSMADYLWCLLADCSREWGMPEEQPVSGEAMLQASAQSL
jgi:heterotetrameric sarcosine oxidase gamma subunit